MESINIQIKYVTSFIILTPKSDVCRPKGHLARLLSRKKSVKSDRDPFGTGSNRITRKIVEYDRMTRKNN